MNDLMNRGGIQNAFEALDGDVFGEIVDTNTKMIREYLEAVL
mgnify:CR=1 FL=1